MKFRWASLLPGVRRLAQVYEEGLRYREQGKHAAALACFEAVLEQASDHVEALEKRGNVLLDLGRSEEALSCYERVLAASPERLNSAFNKGLALLRLNRPAEALEVFDALLKANADDAEVWSNRGNAQSDLRQLEEARSSYETAAQLQPTNAQIQHNLALVYQELRRPDLAAACFARVHTLSPSYPQIAGKLLHARMQACDWEGLSDLLATVERGLARGVQTAEPFGYQGISASPALQRHCAELAARSFSFERRGGPAPLARKGARIRVGYVSGEFRQQATSVLAAELFEQHDRQRFEVVAFDNGWDDGSALRTRLVRAFDQWVDISRMADAQAAQSIREREIDVLVDLNGWFGRGRPGVFALRPAPVQVNYLGFPGTSGAPWMDYIVADATLVEAGDEGFYTETVVRLSRCYQPNDRHRDRPKDTTLRRVDAGLPETGLVFCCFNNTYKITPEVFGSWMRILSKVPGSVLWLLRDNVPAEKSLRLQAEVLGIDAERLVFAPRQPLASHLARHKLADLFLDTTPCNAHTTASDALWSGLPVLTCRGTTFSSRVAASLLRELGMAALVTDDLASYEAKAVALANEPGTLAAWRRHLERVRTEPTGTLFDGHATARQLEVAYARMLDQARSGALPVSFDVPTVVDGTA